MRLLHTLAKTKNKKFTIALGLLIAVSGFLLLSAGSPAAPVASAADSCNTTNNILPNGTSSPSNFINQVNNSSELQHIYADGRFGNGLPSSQYANFKANAQHGYTSRNGGIYLDNGTKVGDGAGSIGRLSGCQGSGVRTFNISGAGTYYGNSNDQAISSSTPNLSVYVLLNANGKAVFAVITSCGNPLYFTPPPAPAPPQAATCSALNVNPGTTPQNFSYTTTAPVSNGASISYVVYDFGDNTSSGHANPGTAVAHTYDSGGSYTVKTTVHAVVNGRATTIQPAGNCIRKVSVPKPNYACVLLTGALTDQSNNTYTFTVTGDYGAGVTPKSATVDFGDKSNATVSMTGKTASLKHAYKLSSTSNGTTYTAVATINFTAYGQSKAATSHTCQTPVAVSIPYCLSLTGPQLGTTNVAQFTATSVNNGRTLKYAVFNFGDNSATQTVNATTATTVAVSHQYLTSGPYDASAVLHFVASGKAVTAPACTARINVTITPECKPGIPLGDVRCTPCATNPNYPASDTVHCVVPQPSLPNTGAGDTIAIFSAVVIGGFIIYRQLLYRQHKAVFVAAEQGTSYLPLADPLNDAAPLSDTPLAPKRSSFRRKRPF